MSKRTILKIGIAIILLAAIGGIVYFYQMRQSADSTKAKLLADVYTVKAMNLKATVDATGMVEPLDYVDVSSKITARIQQVLVKENEQVKKGQILAILDGKDLKSEETQAQDTVDNTLSKYKRAQYLYSIGAESKADLETAQYNYDVAKSNLGVAQTNLAETRIAAPMDGVVLGNPATPGTMAVQGTSNPTIIMRIADLAQKQILAKVDETDIGQVKVGQTADFTVDAYENKNFRAKVIKISKTDTANSWDNTNNSTSSNNSNSVIYYYVTLAVEDPDNILLPSMTARVTINTADKKDVLTVPLAALKSDNQGSYVILIDKADKPEKRYVKTGIYSDEYVEIVEGLQAGDRLSLSYTMGDKGSNSGGQHPRRSII